MSSELTQLTIVADLELMALLEQIKNLNSHKNLSQAELLKLVAREYLKRNDPAQKPLRKQKITAKTEVTTRYISARVRKEVWVRDKGQCTYPGCNSKHRLQYDHILPYSMGGSSTSSENLRLRCQAHNERAAIEVFGLKKMQAYSSTY